MGRKLFQGMSHVCQVWVEMHVPTGFASCGVRLSSLPALQAIFRALEHTWQQGHGSSQDSCSHHSISPTHMPMQDDTCSHLALQ